MLISGISNAAIITIYLRYNLMNSSRSGRDLILSKLLVRGTTVLTSKQNSAPYDTDLNVFFNSLSVVSSSSPSNELSIGMLKGIDLLFINNGCCGDSGQPYSVSETTAITGYLTLDGNL
ncbi:MAG: hypothetical protein ACJAS1_005117 [Oleiphilaceae bacterium]|jgi:hypothetical protein